MKKIMKNTDIKKIVVVLIILISTIKAGNAQFFIEGNIGFDNSEEKADGVNSYIVERSN